MITSEVQAKVQQVVEKTVREIESKYNCKFLQPVKVRYDINSGRLGGQALVGRYTIRLNPHFLGKYGDDYINRTVVHEVVHLGVGIRYGYSAQAHGWEWQQMMRSVGADPSRCHSYEADEGVGRQKTKYTYNCALCNAPVVVGPKVHSKLQAGHTYFHSKCGKAGRLVFLQVAGQVSYSTAKKQAQDPTFVPPAPPLKTSGSGKAPSKDSKLGKCFEIYKEMYGVSRKNMIARFVLYAGCTQAGASTYYATCSKLYNEGVQ